MAKSNQQSQLEIPELKTPREAFRGVRNYLAGQHLGATRDDTLLDEVLKVLFCKLYIETGEAAPIPTSADAIAKAEGTREIFSKVRAEFPDIYKANSEILLDPNSISEVLRLCSFSILDSDSDPIGDAFEVFVGSEAQGRAGQFFTPRVVTDFLVRAIDPQPGERVIDPACGAGGFLASVIRHWTLVPESVNRISGITGESIFGIDKDEYLTKLARLHVALLAKAHPQIVCADSIALRRNGESGMPEGFGRGEFDVVLTNPPFGTRIVAATPEVLNTFELARKWRADSSGKLAPTDLVQSRVPPQVLFVERCLSFLKDGGRLGIVVPESLISNKSYRYVVEYLRTRADVRAVFGMPDPLFKTSGKGGTHTKTCLVIAQKLGKNQRPSPKIFMAEATWCGHDSRARSIPKNDLPEIAARYELFKSRKALSPSTLGYSLAKKSVQGNVLRPRYYDPSIEMELKHLSKTHKLISVKELVDAGVLSLSTGDEVGKLAYGTGNIPFIRTSDISNWEIKADPKHTIDRSIYDALGSKQDVRPNDILMVRDGTYLVGTCALISKYDQEIVFQSHIFKIRVHQNDLDLNPYLLLALLSSKPVRSQVKAKQFTQDIIDSLGDRVLELILPIPREKEKREEISSTVRKATQDRIEARELARKAVEAVAQ